MFSVSPTKRYRKHGATENGTAKLFVLFRDRLLMRENNKYNFYNK